LKKNAIVITNGCPENRVDCAETELFLLKNGWKIIPEADQADLIILNLCGLLNKTEKKSLELIKLANEKKKKNAKLIVTGCLPKINNASIMPIFKGDIIKGHDIKRTSDLLGIEGTPNDISANYLIPNDLLPLKNINKIRRRISKIQRKIRSGFDLFHIMHRFQFAQYRKYWEQINIVQPNTFYIKVASGCVHTCSYCAVKRSRGSVKSKPVDAIKTEFLKGLESGYTQFALVGTDLGSYGADIQTDLPALLREMVSIDGKYEIKLRNVHPQLLINKLSELLSIVKTNKITHITTAVQHGNDRMLGLMKRSYNIKDCTLAIGALKNTCPTLKIRAQLIVGFPGETHSEFNDTLGLIGRIKVDFVEVYPYSPRIGTLAAKMPNQLSEKTINKRRFIAINKLLKTLKDTNVPAKNNEHFVLLPIAAKH